MRAANRGRAYVHWYFGGWQARLAHQADALVVDTAAAKADVADGLGLDPQRIAVTGIGIDERFFDIVRAPSDAAPFVLAVGTVEQRKDLVTAVRAVASLDGVRLVSAGPLTPYAAEVRAEAQRLGIGDRIELLGYVADDRLRELYARTSALVFPSRYEGFGLPPLQALASGVPVVASDIAVLREVLGDSARFAPAGDVRAFASALKSVLIPGEVGDVDIARGRLRARTFSWPAVAQRMVAIYESLVH
jgi:glycosyltransferase involved in cell wall biosynthesis